MKLSFYILLIVLLSKPIFSQTFSGIGLPIAQGTWNNSQFVDVNVSGLSNPLTTGVLELIQVNIEIQSTSSISSRVGYDVISPNGTTIILKQGGGQHGNTYGCAPGTSTIKHYDVKYRDPCSGGGCNNLQKLCDAGSYVQPFSGGYYGPETSCTFQNTIGENPNGTWQIHFYENSISTTPQIVKVELVFGYLDNVNITNSTANDVCSNPQPFCDQKPVCYENTNHTGDVATDPFVSSSNTCNWNNAINNTGWFSWIASSTTATVSISGLSSSQQVIAFGDNVGNCDPNDYFVLNGGCPTDAVNSVNNYSNGSFDNIVLNITGLSVGNTYYLAIDGNSGDVSQAYLSVKGAVSCNSLLPVEMVNLRGINDEQGNYILWTTLSENNSDYFVVQKSIDNQNWDDVTRVKSAGTSSQAIDYSAFDNNVSSEITYYRIKQVDMNGAYKYSNSIVVKNENVLPLIYPNPFSDLLRIAIKYQNNVIINVIDYRGNVVFTQLNYNSNESISLNNLERGTYILQVISSNQVMTTKIIKE